MPVRCDLVNDRAVLGAGFLPDLIRAEAAARLSVWDVVFGAIDGDFHDSHRVDTPVPNYFLADCVALIQDFPRMAGHEHNLGSSHALRPDKKLDLDQHAKLTPQQYQGVTFLQSGVHQLRAQLRTELELNPALIRLDGVNGSGLSEEMDAVDSEAVATGDIGLECEDHGEASADHANFDDTEDDRREAIDDDGDWTTQEKVDRAESKTPSRQSNGSEQERHEYALESAREAVTLATHIRNGLVGTRLTSRQHDILELVIGCLDHVGILREDPTQLAGSDITPDELEVVLAMVREVEPGGIGSRDQREYFREQLRRNEMKDSLAYRLLLQDVRLFGAPTWGPIAKSVGVAEADVKEALSQLSRFPLWPWQGEGRDSRDEVLIELFVDKVGSRWSVSLNGEVLPQVAIKSSYRRLCSPAGGRSKDDDHESTYWQVREAQILLSNLSFRNTTLLRVAQAIVDSQIAFFDTGDTKELKTLTMDEVGGRLGLHKSYISKACQGKYMRTPHGDIALRWFFNKGVGPDEVLRELIEAEDKLNPFPDDVLFVLTQARGVEFERRWVSKRRKKLGISPANLRRQGSESKIVQPTCESLTAFLEATGFAHDKSRLVAAMGKMELAAGKARQSSARQRKKNRTK